MDLVKTRAWLRKSLRTRERMKVVDTHVPEAVPRDLVRKVIVLRCHPRILEARLRRKGWGALKIRENVLAEVLDSCYATATEYYGAKKTAQVDTSRVSISKTVDKCKTILKKQPPDKPMVDWIAVLEREHLFERYAS
jgi:adenylate kinase